MDDPEPFLSWLERLVKAVEHKHPLAKVVMGETMESEGHPGCKIYVDTGLEGACFNCTIILGPKLGDSPQLFIGETMFETWLDGRNELAVAEQLLNELVRFYLLGRLKAHESSEFQVTEEYAVSNLHRDGSMHDSSYKFVTHYVVTTPTHRYLVGLSFGYWSNEYKLCVLNDGHVVYDEFIANNSQPERVVIDAISEWDREHRIPLLPRLQAYLTEHGFIAELKNDGDSTPEVWVDFGDGYDASFIVGTDFIRYIPGWKMQVTTTCTPAFLKQAELMQAVAGLSFDKLRNWRRKNELTEPESTEEMIINFDPV